MSKSHRTNDFLSSSKILAYVHLPVCVSNFKTFSNPSSPPQAMNPWSLFQDIHFSFTLLGIEIWKVTTAILTTFHEGTGNESTGDERRRRRKTASLENVSLMKISIVPWTAPGPTFVKERKKDKRRAVTANEPKGEVTWCIFESRGRVTVA